MLRPEAGSLTGKPRQRSFMAEAAHSIPRNITLSVAEDPGTVSRLSHTTSRTYCPAMEDLPAFQEVTKQTTRSLTTFYT